MASLPLVRVAPYPEVLAYSRQHSAEVFHEPSAISADLLFAGLDPNKLEGLKGGNESRRYGFFLVDDESILGWHCARQQGTKLLMESSGIRLAHQGRGHYKVLLKHVVDFAREEGYAAIISTHAADNNRILIAKLRHGFVIKGFEVNPMYGIDVKLVYYFTEGQTRAHQLRVGSRATFDDMVST